MFLAESLQSFKLPSLFLKPFVFLKIIQRYNHGLVISMFEQKSLKEFWNRGITQFPQKGGAIKQAIEVFEVTPKIETIENNSAIGVWRGGA